MPDWIKTCLVPRIYHTYKMKHQKYHTVGTVPKYHTVGTVLKYHTVGTVPKSNRTIEKRGNIDTHNTQMHDCFT